MLTQTLSRIELRGQLHPDELLEDSSRPCRLSWQERTRGRDRREVKGNREQGLVSGSVMMSARMVHLLYPSPWIPAVAPFHAGMFKIVPASLNFTKKLWCPGLHLPSVVLRKTLRCMKKLNYLISYMGLALHSHKGVFRAGKGETYREGGEDGVSPGRQNYGQSLINISPKLYNNFLFFHF